MVYSTLCAQFYRVLGLVKRYNRFKMLDRKNRSNFEKRILGSTNFSTLRADADVPADRIVHAEIADGPTKIMEGSDPAILLKKQKLLERYSSKSNKLKELNSRLVEISETMSSFASHVFQQEQTTTESWLISP